MTTAPAAPTVACPQCGGMVPLGDDSFLRCAFCRATLYADLDRLVRHVVLRPRLAAGEARGALERYLRAAEVDSLLRDAVLRLEYHPWWVVEGGRRRSLVAGSHETAFAEAPRRATETGEGEPFDPDLARSATVVTPTITAEEAAERVEGGRADAARLLHVPVWRVEFAAGGSRFRAIVDAVEGEVDAITLPPSSTRRLDQVAAAWFVGALVLFAVEAAVLPGFWLPVLAFAATGTAIVVLVRRGERGLA